MFTKRAHEFFEDWLRAFADEGEEINLKDWREVSVKTALDLAMYEANVMGKEWAMLRDAELARADATGEDLHEIGEWVADVLHDNKYRLAYYLGESETIVIKEER